MPHSPSEDQQLNRAVDLIEHGDLDEAERILRAVDAADSNEWLERLGLPTRPAPCGTPVERLRSVPMLEIRPATPRDHDAVWELFRQVIETGDTFPFAPDTDRSVALRFWIEGAAATYVAESDRRVVGSYYVKDNQPGFGSHVCNAGYMVDPAARGAGVGRALCAHSIEVARGLGYRAMQFNIVVSTNEGAVRLWQSMGFEIVGTLPEAFEHARLGFVDAFVMHRRL